MGEENTFAQELHRIAAGYQDYLKLSKTKAERGRHLVGIVRDALMKYLPRGIGAYDHVYVSGLPCEWDLCLSRDNPAVSVGKRRSLDARDVVALFEVKAYGIFGKKEPDLSKEERVEQALKSLRARFLLAMGHCPSLSLMCYFSLQERMPPKATSTQYYDLTKRILEPQVLTVIPFKPEIKAAMPLPAMHRDGVAQWRRLTESLRELR